MNATPTLQLLRGWKMGAASGVGLPDCTLIVPTFKRPREMIALLECLLQIPDPPGEVVIVDGSPGEDVSRAVQPWADAVELPLNLACVSSQAGLTSQRNVGIDAAGGDYIFFLDDDCLPEPGYFSAIRDVFAKDSRREVGAVRGFLTNGINKPLTRLWRLRYAIGLVPRSEPGRYHSSGTSGTWDMVAPFSGVRPVDVLAGGASAYRREVFEQDRFSEFFYGYAQGEDLEMSLRIGKRWKLLVCGDARVLHNHAESGRPTGIRRGRMAVRNRYFIWRRHSPDAGLADGLRFWADHALSVAYYLAAYVIRPWEPYFLGYATGTVWGAVLCLVMPPRYEEPPARREYAFNLKAMAGRESGRRAICARE